ncbi:MAG: N-acyl-D-glutamate amidohydrolase [Myxococcota bacterium]
MTVLQQGTLFDGSGAPGRTASVRIRKGKVTEISDAPLAVDANEPEIDARGLWITPGFVDIHTHYDAEVELAPSLSESLRHGVTTIFMGSCSLSAAVGDPTDIADMFTRVEAIPYEYLLPAMRERKDWETHAEYAKHLDALPLGPNVASFVGYSAVRAAVLGLERSLDPDVRPSEEELVRMEAMVEEGYDAGFLGLSLNTLYWDKMGGDRFRSKCLPSTYATWGEIARMVRGVRQRDLNLQVIPNISTKYELLFYAFFSMGFGLRRALKTSLVSIMDLRSSRPIWRLLRLLGRVFNTVGGARFRFQFLPVAFDLWADGFENVVFEEFGAGAAGLHLKTAVERRRLFEDEDYRRRFRRQWRNPISPRVFHRNFGMATVMDCPDRSLIGKTFRDIGRTRGLDEVDAFLDLCAEYGNELRWYTVTGNDRPGPLAQLIASEDNLMGFSDAGAHLRNMGFYNFPLRMLRFLREREARGAPVMEPARAIHRLTQELADWFDLDVGRVAEGRAADVVLLDPEALDHRVEEIHEAAMPEFGGTMRLVRRNPDVVRAVFVNGEQVVENGELMSGVGQTRGPGRFLRTRASGGTPEERPARKLASLPSAPNAEAAVSTHA